MYVEISFSFENVIWETEKIDIFQLAIHNFSMLESVDTYVPIFL